MTNLPPFPWSVKRHKTCSGIVDANGKGICHGGRSGDSHATLEWLCRVANQNSVIDASKYIKVPPPELVDLDSPDEIPNNHPAYQPLIKQGQRSI